MRRCAHAALEEHGLGREAEMCISLVSARAIRRLNDAFRGVDDVTDVLSFPAIDWEGATPGEVQSLASAPERNPQTGRVLLGDVVICCAKAFEQAEDFGHSPLRELCFLTVHGVLHLLGYDHQNAADERAMQAFAERILARFDILRPNRVVQRRKK
jgi:probable rRNA maturation factor